jgi:type IV pilus assembly protein PilA
LEDAGTSSRGVAISLTGDHHDNECEGITMLRRINERIGDREAGFSLIELLVAIIIIGILSAIAIPMFMNQRRKAVDTAAKSDVSTLGKEIATVFVDDNPTSVTIGIHDSHYWLTTSNLTTEQDLGAVSDGVVMGNGTAGSTTSSMAAVFIPTSGGGTGSTLSRDNWCVYVTADGGSEKTWQYSATGGLKHGTCTNVDGD